jgi:CBS domain-containing protein
MRIREAMTNRVARIRAEASMFQAAEAVSLSGASDLMVVDSTGAFMGVLTEGDILRAALPDIDEILGAGGSLEATTSPVPQSSSSSGTSGCFRSCETADSWA